MLDPKPISCAELANNLVTRWAMVLALLLGTMAGSWWLFLGLTTLVVIMTLRDWIRMMNDFGEYEEDKVVLKQYEHNLKRFMDKS